MQNNKPADDENVSFVRSSGNVFADLGLDNADQLLVKADLANAINAIVRERGWTQAQTAERTGMTKPAVSNLGRMKTGDFSQERLQNVLRRLGVDVEIRIHHRAEGGIGTIRVLEAV